MWDLTKTSIFPPQSYQIQNWAIFWNWHALYLSLRYFLFFNDDVNGFQIINNNDQVEFLLVIFEVFWGPNRVIFYIYGTILMYLRTFIIMFWFPHWSSWRTEWHVTRASYRMWYLTKIQFLFSAVKFQIPNQFGTHSTFYLMYFFMTVK